MGTGEEFCSPLQHNTGTGLIPPDWDVLMNLSWCSCSHPFSSIWTHSGIMKTLDFVDFVFCFVFVLFITSFMNSLWNRDDNLALFVFFTILLFHNNRFLITHCFTKLSVSMFRTEQILSVFFHSILPLGGVKHREKTGKCAAFMEMSCSTFWRIIFFLKAF